MTVDERNVVCAVIKADLAWDSSPKDAASERHLILAMDDAETQLWHTVDEDFDRYGFLLAVADRFCRIARRKASPISSLSV